MAQADFSPILIQGSQVPGRVPTPSLLVNDALFGTELSINSADGKLFFKDPSGNVVVLATLDSAAGKFSALDLTGRLDLKMNTGYNLYGSGTAPNYLAGSLGIGAIPTTSSVLSLTKLISGAISSQGINLNATISSSVTTQAVGFRSLLSTQVGTQTRVSLNHFLAAGTTIGSGSSVVNQYGFAVNALTGASNNYAFYANNAYGLGSWNFYSAGSASNYFGGTLGVRTSASYTFLGDPSITALGEIGIQVVGAGKALFQSYDTGAGFDKKFITFGNVQGAFVISRMNDSYFGALSTPFLIDSSDNITISGKLNLLNNVGYNIYSIGLGANVLAGQTSLGGLLGSESLRVTPVASAVNSWEFYGSATNTSISMLATGSDANISMNYVTKNNGFHYFTAAGATQLAIAPVVLSTNYLQLEGATTGNSPIVSAQGTDINIDLLVKGKGTGIVKTPSALNIGSTVATTAGGSSAAFVKMGTTAGFGIYYGSGLPTISAAQGSLYLRSDGSSASTRMYVNTNGATTWTNVTTAI